MNKKHYNKEELLDRLIELYDKYGEIKTSIIDKESKFPTRKCFKRAFGSVKNACYLIGYDDYQEKKIFDIIDAQKELDKRNGHFILLKFNGMKNKNLTKCKICGYKWEVSTDSLLRYKTEKSYGCPCCNSSSLDLVKFTNIQKKKANLDELKNDYPEYKNMGYIYRITNLKNYKIYIGSTKNPLRRWKEHIKSSYLESVKTKDYPLAKAFKKYSVENFNFEVIEKDIPINKLPEREKYFIIYYNSLVNTGWGYNQTLDTECAIRNYKRKGQKCALIDNDNNIIQIFDSYHEAARQIFDNVGRSTSICAVCHNKLKTVSKKRFINIKEE